MPPEGTHADSRKRAEQALKLRCRGRTWQEIADELGYRNRGSATTAVKRLILREPPEDLVTARTYTAGAYRMVTAQLFESLDAAKAAGNHEAVVSISRAIGYIQDKHANLTGQKVIQVQEVDVNVQVHSTASAVVENAEKELLAIAAGRHEAGMLPVLDAEVVEVS